ncbi:ABC transporter permease [Nocardioides sp. zg-578]|nr:ABC transporter permease [Nocardioides marmotae]MTB83047.1 ABC transporter permease subunit [Nocardioides marmotae]
MACSTRGPAVLAPTPETTETVTAPVRGHSRRVALLAGVILLPAGIALAWWAASAAVLVTLVRMILLVAGVLLAITGLGRVAGAVRGKPVDVVFGLAMAWLVLVVSAAALAPWLPLNNHADAVAGLSSPVFAEPGGLGAEHPLGTNNFGLDVLARTVHGARTSLLVALVAVLVGTVVGGLVGLVSGFVRGTTDRVVGILSNTLLAVPPLILLIALGTVLDPSVRSIAFALSLLTIPSMVRLARANTITVAQREYVLAARALGAAPGRLMVREVLPNVLLPVLSLAVVMISVLVVAEASLSFLGIGIEQPEPTWGNMIAEGQGGVMEDHPFILVVPGVCLFLTVFSFNLLGERAQKRWDPRSTKL